MVFILYTGSAQRYDRTPKLLMLITSVIPSLFLLKYPVGRAVTSSPTGSACRCGRHLQQVLFDTLCLWY